MNEHPVAAGLRRVLAPLPARIERSLQIGTAEEMRSELNWLKGALGAALAALEAPPPDPDDHLAYIADTGCDPSVFKR